MGESGKDAATVAALLEAAATEEDEMEASEDWQRAVYEKNEHAVLRRQLVATPWLLLDRLSECEQEARRIADEVRERASIPHTPPHVFCPLAERMDALSGEMRHLLFLLWRGGLWTDAPVEEREAASGRAYHVLRAPFTDGKPQGRPVPPHAPAWQREILGLDPA